MPSSFSLVSIACVRPSTRTSAALLCAFTLAGANAATCNWTGGSGDWHAPAKWSCAAVPTINDDVNIANLSGGTITLNAPAPMSTLNFTSFGTISGTGAMDVAGLATLVPISATTISTVGSRLPNASISTGSGIVFTLNDATLTADSFASLTAIRPVGSNGAAVLNVGARSIASLNVQQGNARFNAPVTITGNLNLSSGSLAATSGGVAQKITLATGATATLDGNSYLDADFVNNGTFTWTGTQSLSVSGNTSWTNNGTFNVQIISSSTTLTNGVTIGVNATKPFINYGTINFDHSGTVEFDWVPGLINHGTINANSGNLLFRWGNFEQYAGETRFNGGTFAGPPKCCNLDNYQIYLRGGKLSGSGTVVGGIENDGGIVVLDGALSVSNNYTQTVKGTLQVTVGGLTPVTDFGVMTLYSRPGVTSPGSVSLAGGVIVNHTAAFVPRSGDRFVVINGPGSSTGRTTTGSGNMSPTFAAFAAAGQVAIAEPANAVFVQARADASESTRGATNGYTVRIVNPTAAAIGVSAVNVQTSSLFTYQAGSTTGLTTANPFTFSNGATQTLSWNLSPQLMIPAGGSQTLRFNVNVGPSTPFARYKSSVTVGAATISEVAAIDVVPTSPATSMAITVNGGRQQSQGGTNQIMIARGGMASSSLGIRVRMACPPEREPCGPLLTVYVAQEFNGRYINVHQLTLDPDQSGLTAESLKSDRPKTGTDYGFWKGQIPGSGVMPGVPAKLFPDWGNHRHCIAYNGDGFGLYPIGCVTDGPPLGTPTLYDPSGLVTDAATSQPIVGASVALYRQMPGSPDTRTLTRDCRTIDTRAGGTGGVWTGAASDTGTFELPGFSPAQISPNLNPQLTGSDGRYAWDVVAGCWYVKVSAPGYVPKISALVGVPAPVTDLDITLQPAAACNLDLDGDGVVRPHTDGLLLARYIGNSVPNIDLTANARNPNSIVAASVIQNAVEAMRDGLSVDVDGDGVVNAKDAQLVMRALFGFRGAALTEGLSFASSARQAGADLRSWLTANCGLTLP